MIEFVNAKLNEWARWRLSGRQALFARPTIYFRKGEGDAYSPSEAVIPIFEVEADRTHTCVMALEPTLQGAVHEFYCAKGNVNQKAARLGCDVRTLYRRIDRSHTLILGYMNDLACGVHVEPWHELVRRAQRRA